MVGLFLWSDQLAVFAFVIFLFRGLRADVFNVCCVIKMLVCCLLSGFGYYTQATADCLTCCAASVVPCVDAIVALAFDNNYIH
jgi:hypothetical protein